MIRHLSIHNQTSQLRDQTLIDLSQRNRAMMNLQKEHQSFLPTQKSHNHLATPPKHPNHLILQSPILSFHRTPRPHLIQNLNNQ